MTSDYYTKTGSDESHRDEYGEIESGKLKVTKAGLAKWYHHCREVVNEMTNKLALSKDIVKKMIEFKYAQAVFQFQVGRLPKKPPATLEKFVESTASSWQKRKDQYIQEMDALKAHFGTDFKKVETAYISESLRDLDAIAFQTGFKDGAYHTGFKDRPDDKGTREINTAEDMLEWFYTVRSKIQQKILDLEKDDEAMKSMIKTVTEREEVTPAEVELVRKTTKASLAAYQKEHKRTMTFIKSRFGGLTGLFKADKESKASKSTRAYEASYGDIMNVNGPDAYIPYGQAGFIAGDDRLYSDYAHGHYQKGLASDSLQSIDNFAMILPLAALFCLLFVCLWCVMIVGCGAIAYIAKKSFVDQNLKETRAVSCEEV